MRRKGTKAALMSVVVAGVLVLALLLAGTLLRMNSLGTGFMEALASFLRDTFSPGSFKPNT